MRLGERQCHVRQREPGVPCRFGQLVHELELPPIARQREVEPGSHERHEAPPAPRLRRHLLATPVFAREPSRCERAPREDPQVVSLRHREDVLLHVPHEDRVRRLLGCETLEPSPLRPFETGPGSSSDLPPPYTSAVTMTFTPASMASWTRRPHSC